MICLNSEGFPLIEELKNLRAITLEDMKIEKDIIELYYGKGYKEKDISKKLKMSINTISSIKSRALKKLRKNVMQEYRV